MLHPTFFRRGLLSLALLLAYTAGMASEPPGDLAASDTSVSDEDRQHWSYQPVRRPAVPAVRKKSWV
ncbi:MAG: hypothetical protein CMJ73_00755, partial [Planctomycetaceae bacterium]|nr:hypothetical protein [Planctomycetaceae bacterium]